jgi:hypothetical protein
MKLTDEQQSVLDGLIKWARARSTRVAILSGGAGTGKTTLLKSLVGELKDKKIGFELLAPTGRAARILSQKTGVLARTIHSEIYQLGDIQAKEDTSDSDQMGFDVSGFTIPFVLKKTDPGRTIFIVDEASMVSDTYTANEVLSFGTGRLLHDLLHYSRILNSQSANTKILFVGDVAQLLPINSKISPALSAKYFAYEFRINPECFSLKAVLRQSEGSLILKNSEVIRSSIGSGDYSGFRIEKDNLTVFPLSESSAIKSLTNRYDPAEKIIITVSNRKALSYNRIIREKRYGVSHLPIQVGDTLLVCKNSLKHNFFNGDLVKVVSVSETNECKTHKLRGAKKQIHLYFREIAVQNIDGESKAVTQCKVFENLLENANINMTPEEYQAVMADFRLRHPDLNIESEQFKNALMTDDYFNALVVKYGYAITCHKAQGGEWNKVIVNFEWSGKSQDFFRWAYTAITRSKHYLGVINDPVFGASKSIHSISPNDAEDLVKTSSSMERPRTANQGEKWGDQSLSELSRLWDSSKKKYFSILEISDEIGRNPLAILVQLYRLEKFTLDQADNLAKKCHCAETVTEAIGEAMLTAAPALPGLSFGDKTGAKWDEDEVGRLVAEFDLDPDINRLGKLFKRSPLALRLKLEFLGLLEKNPLVINAGEPWDTSEDNTLINEFKSNISIEEMAIGHKRSRGSITSRLKRLGLIRSV